MRISRDAAVFNIQVVSWDNLVSVDYPGRSRQYAAVSVETEQSVPLFNMNILSALSSPPIYWNISRSSNLTP